jgi:conjugal transfer pilus assembly protein TraE
MMLPELVSTWRGQQRLLFGSVVLLALMGLTIAAMSVALVRKEQLVVLVPPTLSEETALTRTGGSRDYMRAWGLFVAQALGNVTPGNIAHVRTTLEPLLSAGVYTAVVSRLESETTKIEQDRLSVRFEPQRVLVEEARNRVYVNGISVVETLVGATTRAQVTYEIEISVAGYRPRIDFVNTYEGEPRTAAWLERRALEQGS